jgi:lysophospholipase L1-like esterase
VTQKHHSAGILYDLERYYECGNVQIDNRKENAFKFNVNKLDDIINKIIPHFDKYPLLTSKNLDYLDFRKVAYMMKDGLHLNEKGMMEIMSIKDNMNSKRSFEER